MIPAPRQHERLAGKRLLIFDFDGTVADTSPLHALAFAKVLATRGVAVHYPSIAGMKTLDAMRRCLAAQGRFVPEPELESMAQEKQAEVRRLIAGGLAPLPGVDEFMNWAREGYRLAMVTSGSRQTVELSLAKLGYSRLFDPIICADDVARSKPAPDGFLKCLALSEVPAAEALIFEDSEAGFAAARAAGVDFEDARRFFVEGMIKHGY